MGHTEGAGAGPNLFRGLLAGLRDLDHALRHATDTQLLVEALVGVSARALDPAAVVFYAADQAGRLTPRRHHPDHLDPRPVVLADDEGLAGKALHALPGLSALGDRGPGGGYGAHPGPLDRSPSGPLDGPGLPGLREPPDPTPAAHLGPGPHVLVWPGSDPPSVSEPSAGAATALAVPVRLGGRTAGVLALYGRAGSTGFGPAPFGQDEAAALATLVRQAEAAHESAWLYEEARRLSLTDGLTGLWNRRQFDLRMTEECQRSARFHEPFGLVLVDLDHFKAVNDNHGHHVGDAVLVEVARRLTDAIREVDVAARYGGEEFGLILPKTALAGTIELARRVWEAIRTEAFHCEPGPIRVTASAGAATCPDHGRGVGELVRASDAALYRAKRAGRDRVVPAEPTGAAAGAR
ncbi:MAG: sensor domain-containing diguanylate cyclase [Acidimicrobiales bacterium]